MKKVLTSGALTLCVLLATIGAACAVELPFGGGFERIGSIQDEMDAHRKAMEELHTQMESLREEMQKTMEERLANVKEKADMSVYEPFGLVYDEEKGGYWYDGKRVGLFADEQGRGISFLSINGQVHLKAVRDESGELTGLVELSEDEYGEITDQMQAKLDDMRPGMEERMNEMRQRMEAWPRSWSGLWGNDE